jgi:hypothetical protein
MLRIRSLRKRLARLETRRGTRASDTGRSALIKQLLDLSDSARHLEVVSQNQGHYTFQEALGPGPGLADFGKFDSVVCLSPFEAEF